MTTRKTDAEKKFEKWCKFIKLIMIPQVRPIAEMSFHAGYLAGSSKAKKSKRKNYGK